MKKVASFWYVLAFVWLLMLSDSTYAQGPPGGVGPGPCTSPPCNPPNPPGLAPIDGGILFLLVSGLTLGVFSLTKN